MEKAIKIVKERIKKLCLYNTIPYMDEGYYMITNAKITELKELLIELQCSNHISKSKYETVGYYAKVQLASETESSSETESPYDRWNNFFIKVRDENELNNILKWWKAQGIKNDFYSVDISKMPYYIGVYDKKLYMYQLDRYKSLVNTILIKKITGENSYDNIYEL